MQTETTPLKFYICFKISLLSIDINSLMQVQLKSREFNKLKAAHMKLLKEMQQLSAEVAQQKQVLSQQRMLSAEHQLQDTRLQATIAQQSKLIDYLQGVGRSPGSKGLGRLKV